MEKVVYLLIVTFFVLVASVYEHPIKEEEPLPVITLENIQEIPPTPPATKDLYDFLDALAFKESSNRYHVSNQYGYMGKYQFGQATLKGLGYHVSREEFINDPELQEEAMIDLLLHNREYLLDYIEDWEGKTVNGIVVTESGILAAAHLGGQRNVRNFFRYNKDFEDGNGTKLSYYLERFGGYETGFDTLDTNEEEYIAEFRETHVERQVEVMTR